MRVGGEWLENAGTRAVLGCLAAGGHQALAVGGCVRNAALGQPVADVDIATDAVPDRVTALAEAAGLRVVPTGLAHGTVTVVAHGRPLEVTTFRRDVATDGRHAVVAFSDDIAADAARRDFTINALYADAGGRVIDPLGSGLADLAARRVRFVGDAHARIAEDYLRILRFFRFHAWYADPALGIDAEGLAACAALQDGLDRLSRERVGAELLRLLAAPDPAPGMSAMAQAGILGRLLPGATATALAPLVALEGDAGAPPDPLRRLAALGGVWDAAEALRLSRADARRLEALRGAVTGTAAPGELGYRLGARAGRDVLLLRAALAGLPLPDGWRTALEAGAAAQFPVTAADLMPHLSGPALGARLRALEDRWIASGFRLTKAQLLA